MYNYGVPEEFKDEEKWLKIFNKKSFYTFIVTGVMAIIMYKLLSIAGLIIGLIICAACTILTMIPVAETEYMKGAGNSYAELLLKKNFRKKQRIIYVKHYNEEYERLLIMLKKQK